MTSKLQMPQEFLVSSDMPDKHGQISPIDFGRAHYSYRTVREKFCEAFDAQDIKWTSISNPEALARKDSSKASISNGAVHIAFKPPSHLRRAPGTFNVAHVAWEFDRFPSLYQKKTQLPQDDEVRMLNAFDQTWVGCSFTLSTLQRLGVRNCAVVPAPVAFAKRARSTASAASSLRQVVCWPISVRNHIFSYSGQAIRRNAIGLHALVPFGGEGSGRRCFLQIVNPHDLRKNLAGLIRAFSALNSVYSDAILILKFTCPEPARDIYDHLLPRILEHSHAFDGKGVYFTVDFIPEDCKQTFYELFDFYVSPSRAEGQNLPLQEAMLAGIAAITTDNTAMADYISTESAIVISARAALIGPLDHTEKSFWGLKWHDATPLDIYKALVQAVEMTDQHRKALISRAREKIDKLYSYKATIKSIESALAREISGVRSA